MKSDVVLKEETLIFPEPITRPKAGFESTGSNGVQQVQRPTIRKASISIRKT